MALYLISSHFVNQEGKTDQILNELHNYHSLQMKEELKSSIRLSGLEILFNRMVIGYVPSSNKIMIELY